MKRGLVGCDCARVFVCDNQDGGLLLLSCIDVLPMYRVIDLRMGDVCARMRTSGLWMLEVRHGCISVVTRCNVSASATRRDGG